jgi:hypothetical protein
MQRIFKTNCTLRNHHFAPTLGAIWYLLLVLPGKALCQEPPPSEIDINAFIQSLLPTPTEDSDYSALYDALFQLYNSPLDLNTATGDELATTFILSQVQIKSFLDYRISLGPLLSLYELQAVPHFDLKTISLLLPFVTVQPRSMSFQESLKSPTQHFLMIRSSKLLEQQKGFSDNDTASRSVSRYAGKPLYGYLRYRYARSGAYSFGISFEKDAGEKWWQWAPKKQVFGIDFTSFHAQVLNRGRFKNILLGDFQMQAGQGLVFAAGFSLGKGSEVIRTTYRSTLGLRPYTSSLEAGYFRGAAATYRISRRIDVTAFYSNTRRDASLDESVKDTEEPMVSSLVLSGYHRTPTEREKQGIIPERNMGFHALYKTASQGGQFGISLLHTAYGYNLEKKAVPYNRFEFTGKYNLVAGFHGDYRWQNFLFFGEGARSQSGGLGGVGGIITGLGKKLDFTLLLRYYAKNFHTFYGNAAAEATRPINESGSYWGLKYTPNRRWQLSAFYDYFKFPWLKFQINAPSSGHDYLLHLLYKPSKKFNVYIMYHEKHKAHNLADAHQQMTRVENTIRRTAAINLEYEVPLKYAVKTRLQYGDFSYESGTPSKGVTVAQDISWRMKKLEISARVAIFKTDNYDSRQYVYERDVLYAFSIPAYYDTGLRHYLMGRYHVNKNIKLWLRWSQTRYASLETISSGLNEITGNKRSELKMQLLYQF